VSWLFFFKVQLFFTFGFISDQQQHGISPASFIKKSFFTFFIKKKSNKKIKTKANAPLLLSKLTHKLRDY
jgi:hypothetical protein